MIIWYGFFSNRSKFLQATFSFLVRFFNKPHQKSVFSKKKNHFFSKTCNQTLPQYLSHQTQTLHYTKTIFNKLNILYKHQSTQQCLTKVLSISIVYTSSSRKYKTLTIEEPLYLKGQIQPYKTRSTS